MPIYEYECLPGIDLDLVCDMQRKENALSIPLNQPELLAAKFTERVRLFEVSLQPQANPRALGCGEIGGVKRHASLVEVLMFLYCGGFRHVGGGFQDVSSCSLPLTLLRPPFLRSAFQA